MRYAILNNVGKTLPKRYATSGDAEKARVLLQKMHNKWFGWCKLNPGETQTIKEKNEIPQN